MNVVRIILKTVYCISNEFVVFLDFFYCMYKNLTHCYIMGTDPILRT